MKLYFMRHGIALPADDPAATADYDRPLTDKGARRVRKAAKGMRRLGLSFDLLLSSPLARARQSADIVAGLLHHEAIEELPSLAPESAIDELTQDLARYQDRGSLLLVGHEPSLSGAVAFLIGAKGGRGVSLEFKKSALCCVDIDAPPRPNTGTLCWLLAPKQLRLLGEPAGKR